eukprot:8731821-Ditylum_brightwellii.AAC.1
MENSNEPESKRQCIDKTPDDHLSKEYAHVVEALEQIETKLRIEHIPSLLERAPFVEAEDLKQQQQQEDPKKAAEDGDESKEQEQLAVITENGSASLRRLNLRSFSLSMIPSSCHLSNLLSLDVSKNELMDLPGLSALPNIQTLNLERN